MNDRELLELAAKASGHKNAIDIYGYDEVGDPIIDIDDGVYVIWNPLTDDGDALRLAVKLKMYVQSNEESTVCESWQNDIGETKEVTEYFDPPQDPFAATRRAIVRAAAEIGKGM